ncbi:wax ester/triacylglycerol synthase domain-containing protein [Actinospongicola halichondriae]|uniref:wax ester/triacylglycerol synthase domain-containing protein n=1 Tax=Actinospongicola halichondriae TaxID=3236844 RepID=UPI003D4AEADB
MSDLEFESRMSDSDALMWHIEKDPILRSTITALTVLDRAPDRARLLDKLERGTRLVPRLRQRVVGNLFSLAPPRWEIDPNFDLRYHVRWTNAGGEGTLRDVLDIAEPIAMQGFDRARPLWEFMIVEGLADGKAAMIQKLHHAITDGVGGIAIAMLLLDLERDPAGDEEPMPPLPEGKVLSPAERTADAVGHIARRNLGIARRARSTVTGAAVGALADPFALVRGVGETAASMARMMAPATEPLSPVMTERSLSVHFDTLTFPLADMKAAAKKADGRLNDAFVAGVAGGLRRYHEIHDAPVEALRMNMPINVRTDETENVAGNQFAPARFAVPVSIEDPLEAMAAVRELVAGQRGEPALALLEPMSGLLNRLPTTITTSLFGSMLKGVDFTTSNVPGAPIPVFMGGAEIEMMVPFGPLAGAAVNVTLLSNRDDVHLGINCDLAAVPDPEVLRDCMQASFDALLELA